MGGEHQRDGRRAGVLVGQHVTGSGVTLHAAQTTIPRDPASACAEPAVEAG